MSINCSPEHLNLPDALIGLLDRFMAFLLLLFVWPFLVIAYLGSRLVFGSGFFIQTRMGLKEQTFEIYKIRSMPADTPSVPTHQLKQDFVLWGKLLRISKLDELPQLFNILRGDMSFVGPRPNLCSQSDLIRERRRLGVYNVRPGLTGFAQLMGVDMSTPVKLARLDKYYVTRRSASVNLYLIVRTFASLASTLMNR